MQTLPPKKVSNDDDLLGSHVERKLTDLLAKLDYGAVRLEPKEGQAFDLTANHGCRTKNALGKAIVRDENNSLLHVSSPADHVGWNSRVILNGSTKR